MNDKKKLNQPYYTEPVESKQSIITDDSYNSDNKGVYQNSEVFPPRGSFINIPEDILFSEKAKLLDTIIEDKNKNINSDLYKK